MEKQPIVLESNQKTMTEKRYGEYHEDDLSVTIRSCGATCGFGSEVLAIVNSSGGGIAGTLDSSYYKGCGERQGIEREYVAVIKGCPEKGGA